MGESSARPKILDRGLDALSGAAALVLAEWMVVGWIARNDFAGPWEVWDALWRLVPLAWLIVAAGALVGAGVLVIAGHPSRWSLPVIGLVGGVFGAAVGLGVSQGRHLSAPPARVMFILALAVVAFGATYAMARPVARLSERAVRIAALVAATGAVALELANRFILPRLYPAFHLGLVGLCALTAPFIGGGLRQAIVGGPSRSGRWGAVAGGVLMVLAMASAPSSARRLSLSDNVRWIFYERAPLLGRGVELAARLAPPPPLEPAREAEEVRGDGRLEIDWRQRDFLLVSVDALRADHVGAYGYARPTTPNIDRLAGEGSLFLRAYCPTPHTSYSVTSMMTGKNLRPLLVQGLGLDSDTFAGLLRTYGYRTAAFYPPAVFFIDEELFAPLRDRKLDFEYARIEFADPQQRANAVRSYLETAPADRSLFMWVHLFEPHEPYVSHDTHVFGERDVDRYDSEIALADEGIGAIVDAVRARRPSTVVIVTADHGEEFGEHGGRYHGTTVFEEQVRVPLVIAAPGLTAGRRIEAPIQTIDILPTVLAALDVPRPPRIRGHSLARWLVPLTAGGGRTSFAEASAAPGAFVITDDQAMIAQGEWRLICARKAGACTLYNLDVDPGEGHDVSASERERFLAMKLALRQAESSQGYYESPGEHDKHARPWPDAIRRGLAGDGDAAREIAGLLDDSDLGFRRKAAEVLFDLNRKETAPELRLALSRDEDDLVRRYCALALTRLGEGAPRTMELLADPQPGWRRLAALALAENGDGRGAGVLVSWWQSESLPYLRAREVLAAIGQIRAKDATPVLVRSLDDVRLRPYVADALAAIGQSSARAPLAERWATERYQNARVALGEALLRLGAKRELATPLVRFLGTPDPIPGGLDLARRAGVLDLIGAPSGDDLSRVLASAPRAALAKFNVARGGNGTGRRIVVRARLTEGRTGQVRIGARLSGLVPAVRTARSDEPRDRAQGPLVEIDPRDAVTLEFREGPPAESFATLPAYLAGSGSLELHLVVVAAPNVALEALAVVPLADDLPPPPPTPWEASPTPH